jgi:peptidoglycan/LPS O-acetylase OafA/YrhL
MKCYCIVPLLGLVGLLRRRTAVLGLFSAVLLVHNLYHIPGYQDTACYLPRLTAYFLAGIALYLYRDKIPYSRKWLLASIATVAVSTFWGLSITLPIAGSYIVFYVAFCKRIKLQNFGKHGDISYGIFLYGYLVQQLIANATHYAISSTMLTVSSLATTYALAFASWHLVEKRFLARSSRAIAMKVGDQLTPDTAIPAGRAGVALPAMHAGAPEMMPQASREGRAWPPVGVDEPERPSTVERDRRS